MRTWIDEVGNVHGRIYGADADAPVLLAGSHYDTVIDAGKHDGALGILTAISAIKATVLQARHHSCISLYDLNCFRHLGHTGGHRCGTDDRKAGSRGIDGRSGPRASAARPNLWPAETPH